jgi:hypothetical protein
MIYLALDVAGLVENYVYVGFTVPLTGTYTVNMQAVSSERLGIQGVSYSVALPTVINRGFRVSDGYLAGYPVVKPIFALDSFRKWNPNYQYESEDPVFFSGMAYFANPASIPAVGESPAAAPGKWIILARADSDFDITNGADAPYFFHKKSLVLGNASSIKIRQRHLDVGFQYPSPASLVYHLDGDLYDQDQNTQLAVNSRIGNGSIPPRFVNSESPVVEGALFDPAIPLRPFKEEPYCLYGTFSILINIPNSNGLNTIDYWFKTVKDIKFSIFSAVLPTGETINLTISPEEPFYNENHAGEKNNFPYNYATQGTAVYNLRDTDESIDLIQNYAGDRTVVEVTDDPAEMIHPNEWNHININMGNNDLRIFLNHLEIYKPRKSAGFGGNTAVLLNPTKEVVMIDEVLTDFTTVVAHDRFVQISQGRFAWAEHNFSENWLIEIVDDPLKMDSNVPLYYWPVGALMLQVTTGGIWNNDQVPWKRFHCFTQNQWTNLGDQIVNLETIRFWKRTQ